MSKTVLQLAAVWVLALLGLGLIIGLTPIDGWKETVLWVVVVGPLVVGSRWWFLKRGW